MGSVHTVDCYDPSRWWTKTRPRQKACACRSTHMCGFWKEGGVGMSGSLEVGFTGGLAKFNLSALRLPGSQKESSTLLDTQTAAAANHLTVFNAPEISLHLHSIPRLQHWCCSWLSRKCRAEILYLSKHCGNIEGWRLWRSCFHPDWPLGVIASWQEEAHNAQNTSKVPTRAEVPSAPWLYLF